MSDVEMLAGGGKEKVEVGEGRERKELCEIEVLSLSIRKERGIGLIHIKRRKRRKEKGNEVGECSLYTVVR